MDSDERRLEFAERMSMAFDRTGRNQADIARRIGVSQPVLSKYLRGGSEPQVTLVPIIAKELGVDLVWLITGEGSMDPSAEVTDPATRSLNRPTRLTAADVADPVIFDDVTIAGMMRFVDLMASLPEKSRIPQIGEKLWHVAMLEVLIAYDKQKKMAVEAAEGDKNSEKLDDKSD